MLFCNRQDLDTFKTNLVRLWFCVWPTWLLNGTNNFLVGILLHLTAKLRLLDNKEVSAKERWLDNKFTTFIAINWTGCLLKNLISRGHYGMKIHELFELESSICYPDILNYLELLR